MKKAVVIGGSNGIGLAISKVLIDKGYFIEVCDCSLPEEGVLNQAFYNYNYCDLLDFDEIFFKWASKCSSSLTKARFLGRNA